MEAGMEFWAAHVAAIEQEAVSASAYARGHGLSLASLYYWRRKLKVAAGFDAAGPASQFVALRVADAAPATGACTLVLPSGLRLELPALPEPAWLAALEQAARGAR